MPCVHIRELYQLCQQQDLRIGATDLVRLVCNQCGAQEVCPSNLMEELDEPDAADQTSSTNGPTAAE